MKEYFISYKVEASRNNPVYRACLGMTDVINLRDIVEGRSYLIKDINDRNNIFYEMKYILEDIKQKHNCDINEITILNINKL